ncbi:MAG: ParB/RepB/Spo0J family partition protein [Deltaproteobacteria bacterium]|nr:ParB/RepB/Spo0J family partition protein [Deltaproteobacteria bacterium]
MQPPKKALGRGLESLISKEIMMETVPPAVLAQEKNKGEKGGYHKVPIEKIVPNRQQPRSFFDEAKIRELAESIKEEGVLQPLIVSSLPDGRYEIIAGERRFRASREAGLTEVPVIIRNVDSEDQFALAILENVQREDLNAIEEAKAYQDLMDQYEYSQEDVAKKMGKSRVAIANSVRLLKLPRVVQDDVACGRYSAGHARALLALTSIHEQMKLREIIIQSTPTVRDVEKMVQLKSETVPTTMSTRKKTLTPQETEIIEKLMQTLGTKVELKNGSKGGGRLTIEYYAPKDLDRIFRRIVAS